MMFLGFLVGTICNYLLLYEIYTVLRPPKIKIYLSLHIKSNTPKPLKIENNANRHKPPKMQTPHNPNKLNKPKSQ